jgi:type I restriction enzyme M protein
MEMWLYRAAGKVCMALRPALSAWHRADLPFPLSMTGIRWAIMFEQAFKNIDDVLWKAAGCTTELDYTEQSSWRFGATRRLKPI